MANNPKVSMRNITKRFGGALALDDVSLDIYSGEIHSIAGVNGAGKSTLMKVLQGVYPPTSGKIFIDGKETVLRDPRDANRYGIAMIYQELNLFVERSVAENVLMDMFPSKNGFLQWKQGYAECRAFLEELGIDIDPTVKVKTLSLAQKQLIEIAKCVKRNPQVLVFDEPSSSLSQQEEKILYRILLSLRDKGLAIMFITHKMSEILDMANRITVLRDGKLISSGPVSEYDMDKITDQMLGKSVHFDKVTEKKQFSDEDVVLEVENLSLPRVLEDVSFKLHKGEILAVSGLVGSGKSELARLLYGMYGPQYTGTVRIGGKPVKLNAPRTAIQNGLAYMPINRKEEGILHNFSVKQNVTASIIDKLGFWLNRDKETVIAEDSREKYGIKAASMDDSIGSLSGGNQQKVILARWLVKEQNILLLDEPTRGIDVGAKKEIYAHLRRLAQQGMSFLMISSEIEEILSSADRILVLRNGRVITEGYPSDFDYDTLLQYFMAGSTSQKQQ